MKIKKLITNIRVRDLQKSKTFYEGLLDLSVRFDSDWYVQLHSQDQAFEIGLLFIGEDIIPKAYQKKPQGVFLTFIIGNIEKAYEKAKKLELKIVEDIKEMPNGHLRFLVEDPDGVLLDISEDKNARKFK